MQRLEGEAHLSLSPDNPDQAATCFQRAISTAQEQGARSWERRASTSLARLLAAQGDRQAALEVLNPIQASFHQEPKDTTDHRETSAFLAELA